jgi:hypothetical protein
MPFKCDSCKKWRFGKKYYPMGYGPVCNRCAGAGTKRLKKEIKGK